MNTTQKSEVEDIEKKINQLKTLNIDNFQSGLYVDILDDTKNWCSAQIIARNGDTVKIHFDGWSSKYDEVRLFFTIIATFNQKNI